MEPGLGSRVHVDAAAGQLSWIRTEATVSVREYVGPVTLGGDGTLGAVFSAAPPPQTLFELGGNRQLSGYQYKAFAGDRAAIFRGNALYSFPILRAPYHVKWFRVPGLTPAIGAGITGGWTGISTDAAQRAILAFGDGTDANALSHATGRVRTTASLSLSFFAQSVSVGVARRPDQPGPWRWFLGSGPGFKSPR